MCGSGVGTLAGWVARNGGGGDGCGDGGLGLRHVGWFMCLGIGVPEQLFLRQWMC